MDSSTGLQNFLNDNRRELIILSFGAGVLALLSFSKVLPLLLESNAPWIVAGLLFLGGVVVLLSQQVANQAELLAKALGEPYGTLVLTLSVIVIELSLISSTMLTGEENPTLARDSMFSVLMIALTGITGLCMTLTSWLNRRSLGSNQYLSEEDLTGPNMAGSMVFYNLISTMSVMVLIIPNFSTDTAEGNFSLPINAVLTVVSVGVYSIFLANQMGPYRCFFMDPGDQFSQKGDAISENELIERPWQATALMLASLAVVVLIAESMGLMIERGVNELNLPAALGGVLVAILILIPEVLNAVQATRQGQLQRALNTLFGSVLATISLTVPAILVIGEITGKKVILGLDPAAMVLLSLTLFLLRPHPKVLGSEGLMLLVVFLFWLVFEIV